MENIHRRLFSIYIKEKIYSCTKWELTGIPCSHAIASIWVKNDEPEIYVHECYTVDQYMKSYNPPIFPILSFDQWPMIGIKPPLRHNKVEPKTEEERN